MRKGIGTTLGIIFFFGILFSTIVPLQMYVKDHKHLKIRIDNEMQIEDNYRKLESLYVLGYPKSDTSNEIMVRVRNRGPIPVTLQRVWIKDQFDVVSTNLEPGAEYTLGPYTVVLEENTNYGIKVSTNRGRVFSSETGNLFYLSGTWISPTFGVAVQIANDKGKYYVEVSNSTWSSFYLTQGMDFNDVLVFFDVKTNGYYTVVCKKNSSSGPHLPGSPTIVEIDFPRTPPVVFMYTSGYDT